MWSAFLSRNGMPADTPHEAAVLIAGKMLLTTLDSGVPAPSMHGTISMLGRGRGCYGVCFMGACAGRSAFAAAKSPS
jgi:hypothetical protein